MEDIKVGHIFKNNREACEFIGLKYKDSTNSRKAQEKEFSARWAWHKKGRKIIVDEVYSKVKAKVDNRGKSKGSRNNYKGIYAEYIDILLLQYLQGEDETKSTYKIHTTNNKIAEETGIVNINYRCAYNEREKFYNTVKKDFNIKKDIYCMKDVFYWTKSKIREIVKASLDRLQKLQFLEYESCYFVYVEYPARVPTEAEMEAIIMAEEEMMREMGIENKKQIGNNYKLCKEFDQRVLERIQENFCYIEGIFKGYAISLLKHFKVKSYEEIEGLWIKLNNLVVKSLKEKVEKIHEKAIEEEYMENPFDESKVLWRPWVFERISKRYIENCYSFIDILCSKGAPYIGDEIKACEEDKIKLEYKNKVKLEEIELPY